MKEEDKQDKEGKWIVQFSNLDIDRVPLCRMRGVLVTEESKNDILRQMGMELEMIFIQGVDSNAKIWIMRKHIDLIVSEKAGVLDELDILNWPEREYEEEE